MPANGFSIGKDISLVIVTPSGPLPLPLNTKSFTATPRYHTEIGTYLDGEARGFNAPAGWDLKFDFDRADDTVDAFFAQQEAGYYAGLNTLTGTISETISEANGSVSQYRYTKVILKLDEAGKFAGDNKVGQSMSAFASRKLKVA